MRHGVSGDELRALRVVNRISQAELAKEMGSGQSWISQMELKYVNTYQSAERYRAAVERLVARARAS